MRKAAAGQLSRKRNIYTSRKEGVRFMPGIHRIRSAKLTILSIIAALLWTMASTSAGRADTWEVVKSPNKGSLNVWLLDVATISATDAWAVGESWSSNGSNYASFVTRYNGKTWKTVNVPGVAGRQTYLHGVRAISASDIWAVGGSKDANGHTLIMHYNGSKWTVVSSPSPSSARDVDLLSVVAVAPNDIWAVGIWHSLDPTDRYKTLILHYDGSTWRIVVSPNPGQGNNYLLGVAALSSTSAIAVGGAWSYDNKSVKTTVLRWDGKTWKTAPSPALPDRVGAEGPARTNTGGFLTSSLLYEDLKGNKSYFVGGLSYSRSNALVSTAKATTAAPKWKSVACPSVSPYGSFIDGFASADGDTRVVGVGGAYTKAAGYRAVVEVFSPSGSTWKGAVSLDGLTGITADTVLAAVSPWLSTPKSPKVASPTFWAVGHSRNSDGKYQTLILKGVLSD
jgi:hypothetical protein